MKNMMLPGNPRYQPKQLVDIFGYDNLYRFVAEVEIATMQTLGEIGIISNREINLLTPKVIEKLLSITTTDVDRVEREITKHDIRAWVRIAQGILPTELRRWVHIPLTSYDVLDTARSIQFVRAHDVLKSATKEVVSILIDKVREFSCDIQIGRTHGQHALPITVGFWLATILDRVITNAEMMNFHRKEIVGKISGAVGAYNAQVGLGITEAAKFHSNFDESFEDRVLSKLKLKSGCISTQILPPEPLAYYLFSCLALSASLGQFGRDCRNLMRSEIAEICEPFDKGQVGSSTMAHKRNPINFENLEGMYLRTKNEFGKVLDTLISEHQRDLVGSCVARDLPIIVINLMQQLNTLLRKDKNGNAFLSRISVDKGACKRNFRMQGKNILAEPMYIALQMAGFEGDAHDAVNHKAIPLSKKEGISLLKALKRVVEKEPDGKKIWKNIPRGVLALLDTPERYIGSAPALAVKVAELAERYSKHH